MEPNNQSTSTIQDKELSKDDMYDLLKDDTEIDDIKKDTEKDQVPEEKEDKDKDEEEVEIDEEEKEQEDEEEPELVVAPRRKEILKAFPELFKKFPYIEKALYRDQQFTEIFSTPKEAREISDDAKMFKEFQHDILQDANIEKLLYSVKNANENTFNRIADNYLSTLAKVDKNAYVHVVGQVIDNMIGTLKSEGKKRNIEEMGQAADIVSHFFLGTDEPAPRAPLAKSAEKNPEEEKLQQERQRFLQERFESARDDLNSRVQNALKSTIDQHIDPKDVMTSYVKNKATQDALDKVESLIEQDDKFQSYLERLWDKVFESNFSRASIDRVRSAYFTKAKTLLPDAIRQSRNDALKGQGPITQTQRREEKDRKGPLPAGRTTQERKSSATEPAVPKGMKTLDFLMQDQEC